jgi:plastocyanin domain-containing protein
MNILINLIGFSLIIFIIWWFWLDKKTQIKTAQNNAAIEIIVESGIYNPAEITVEKDKEITLHFFRKDPSPCAEAVIFPTLGKSQELPLNQIQEVKLQVNKTGIYEFTCPMGMYRGKLVVTKSRYTHYE